MLKRLGLGRESSLRITVHLQTPSWHSELHSPSWMMTVLPEAKVQLILYRMVHAEEYLADRQLSEFRLRLLFTCIHEHKSECVCVCGGGTVREKKRSVCLSQAALNIAIQVREYHKAISFLKLSVAVRRQFVKKINGVTQTTKQTVLGPGG